MHRRFLTALTLWGLAAAAATASGLTASLPIRLLPLPIVLLIAAPLLVYARSSAFRSYIHALDLRSLTLFHVWRVPAALAFLFYGAQGELPLWFVRNAGWGDLVVGLLAPLAVVVVARASRFAFAGFVAFHVVSITDFAVAVGTGLAFSLAGDPLMATMKEAPMAIIPLFGVPVTGALSIMTLHRLAARRA